MHVPVLPFRVVRTSMTTSLPGREFPSGNRSVRIPAALALPPRFREDTKSVPATRECAAVRTSIRTVVWSRGCLVAARAWQASGRRATTGAALAEGATLTLTCGLEVVPLDPMLAQAVNTRGPASANAAICNLDTKHDLSAVSCPMIRLCWSLTGTPGSV